ncbi:three-Cys-motif partner protein TcmP [Pusillimonas sp. NJUB218]|uniref:three-Cys-motif partner protein TcmP n=1 Tax=Pusillimonas sp. NJUB218 TaxID=2023230 RepID=UPI000F4C0782|nr:three-Cys-motif partner protein TcmP [Pusillimonas sp. NJUB218]ROT43868.1 hypothetical protein CHR62_15235 [Pusillimonas sp. NJUB218]
MPHYQWIKGNTPPRLKRHSEVKHNLLRDYLVNYFLTLVAMPQQDRIQLTIVDGFCGGGLYLNEEFQEVVGSPLVILESVKEAKAQIEIRQSRRKPIDIDVVLICIDESKSALEHLKYVLESKSYGPELATGRIELIHGSFEEHYAAVTELAHSRSRIAGRALFILDQYGYNAVPVPCLQGIFAKLKRAEIILTFAIDALLTFLDPNNLSSFEKTTGLDTDIKPDDLDNIKQSPRWRGDLQSKLYSRLTSQSGARYYTPFFIRPERGHGDFWLLHLSQHWKARDVMATAHWEHNNHFAHYGQAGIDMFSTGYIGRLDDTNKLQQGFDFSPIAAEVSKETMLGQIPRILFDGADGISYEKFFLDVINTTPANQEMVKATVLELHQLGEIRILDERGEASRARSNIKPTYRLKLPAQKSFAFK